MKREAGRTTSVSLLFFDEPKAEKEDGAFTHRPGVVPVEVGKYDRQRSFRGVGTFVLRTSILEVRRSFLRFSTFLPSLPNDSPGVSHRRLPEVRLVGVSVGPGESSLPAGSRVVVRGRRDGDGGSDGGSSSGGGL